MRNIFGFFFVVFTLAILITIWREAHESVRLPIKVFLKKHWYLWMGIVLFAWGFLYANSQFTVQLF